MKDRIKLLIFVIVLGAISAGTLTAMNYYTKPRVERNIEIKRMSSVLGALGFKFSSDEVVSVFEDNVTVKIDAMASVTYFVTDEREVAFVFYGNGLWGPISGIMALHEDLETIIGITIIHQEETPGLGGVIASKEYLDKFKEKKTIPEISIVVGGTGSLAENEVDAIAGATLTSKAFEKILNTNIVKFKEAYEN